MVADEGAHYDQVIEINLNELEPHINGPFTPDLAHPLSKFADAVRSNGWPSELKVSLDLGVMNLILDNCLIHGK